MHVVMHIILIVIVTQASFQCRCHFTFKCWFHFWIRPSVFWRKKNTQLQIVYGETNRVFFFFFINSELVIHEEAL